MVLAAGWVATTPGVAAAISRRTRPGSWSTGVRVVLLVQPGRVVRRAGLDEQRPGGRHLLITGVLLLPVLWVLLQNVVNVAVVGGILAANDRLGLFLGLILPHGLLELTAVFVAAGAGLKLGWTWTTPARSPAGGRWRGRAG